MDGGASRWLEFSLAAMLGDGAMRFKIDIGLKAAGGTAISISSAAI